MKVKAENKAQVLTLGAAVCLSSVTQGTLKASLCLSLCVLGTVVFVKGATLLSKGVREDLFLFGAGVTSLCVSASALRVCASFLSLSGLETGVFIAAGAVSSLLFTLGFCDGEYCAFASSVCTSGIYALIVTSSGVFRELFGHAALWGRQIPFLDGYGIGVLKTHTGGMLVCALLLALAGRLFVSKENSCGI